MQRSNRFSLWSAWLAFLYQMIAANGASAAVWQWGCMGSLGEDQIAFNRDHLVIISGKSPAGKLDDFVHAGIFATDPKHLASSRQILATYKPDEVNNGLDAAIIFNGE